MAPRALRPFAHRDYRTLMAALVVSVFGHGMWAVAMVYQVRRLGGGPVELSVVATATSVGLLAFVLIVTIPFGIDLSARSGSPVTGTLKVTVFDGRSIATKSARIAYLPNLFDSSVRQICWTPSVSPHADVYHWSMTRSPGFNCS